MIYRGPRTSVQHSFRAKQASASLVISFVLCTASCKSNSDTPGSGGHTAGTSAGGSRSGGAGAGGSNSSKGPEGGSTESTGAGGSAPYAAAGGGASTSSAGGGVLGSGGAGPSRAGGASFASGGASGVGPAGGASPGDASGAGGLGGGAGGAGGSRPGDASGTGGADDAGTTGAGGGSTGVTCPAQAGAPTGTPPLPSAAQLSYQRTEMTAFIHYGLATYDGSEQGSPSDSPSIFNPSNLNATTVGQWASSLKAAGFGQAMLVTKHSVGFTLWPSKYTDYSVKSSPWMSGKGDVVQLFTDAMHSSGMRPAIYLSPWDQKYPSSKSDYITYFKNQLTEVLGYGPAYELEFDGANSGTLGTFDWKSVFQFVKQAQPNILIWAGPEIARLATPDLQWIGNENGQASRTTSSLDTTNCGGGNTWCPYECNTSSHRPSWFWHPGSSPMSLADMQKVYFQTVGMNCTLIFNVPPSQTGEFDPKDLALLQQFASWYSGLYKTNLFAGQPTTSDSTWSAAGFEAAKATDGDICSYWAAASGKTSAQLTVTPASPITINLISVREAIELGERVSKYHVEIQQNGTWNTAPTDRSGSKIQGTVIGNRQLWQLSGTSAQAVRLVIDSAKDVPAIAEFAAY